jgi:hypothetical protein
MEDSVMDDEHARSAPNPIADPGHSVGRSAEEVGRSEQEPGRLDRGTKGTSTGRFITGIDPEAAEAREPNPEHGGDR